MLNNLEAIHNLSDLREKHKDDFELGNTGDRIERVLQKWHGKRFVGDWRILAGARVLDLGCGTALSDSCYVYPPYFCRIAASNGAEVYGIDRFPPLPEDALIFNHIQADFVDAVSKNRLRDLFSVAGISFNIIHLWRGIEKHDPLMIQSLNSSGLSMRDFLGKFVSQVKDLLVEGGLLVVENEFLHKNEAGFEVIE